ncbi:hypothetical protein, partial [Streptomyces sp. R11]|uniref:hypothetical protein n=1 Tax=Streptomyces sp. R11 TaxID=3238625 RepID=UPI0034DE703B
PLTRPFIHAQELDPAVPLPRPGCIDVAVHARGRSLEDVIQQVAVAAGVEAQNPVELLQQLPRRSAPFTVLLDALDEATGDDATRIASLLGRIALDPARHGLRVLVGTRRSTVLARLGNRLVIDLDSTQRDSRSGLGYLELADVESFVARRVGRTGRNGLAHSITDHANGNFLVAQLASAAALAAADSGTSWEALLPADLGEAVDGYLNIRFGDRAETVRDLLTAVAFAEHPGFGEGPLWLSVAESLTSARHSPADLARMIASAGSYLVEQTTVDPPAYRLFHQALDDTFRVQYGERFPSRNGHRLVYRALLEQVPADQDGTLRWERAAEYLRVNMAAHAVAAGCLDELVQDVGYLITAPPERLLPQLGHVVSEAARAAAFVYRRASHQFAEADCPGRAAVLILTARQTGFPNLAEQAEALFSPTWSGRPVRWEPESAEQTLARFSKTYATALWFDPEGNPAAWFSGQLWRTHGYLLQPDDGVSEDSFLNTFHANAVHVHDDGSETALSLTGEGILQYWALTGGVRLLGELALEDMGFTMTGDAGLALDADGRLLGVVAANGVIHLVDVSGDGPQLLDRLTPEGLEPLRKDSVTIADQNGELYLAWFETVTVAGASTVRVQLARVAEDRLVRCGAPIPDHTFNPEVVQFLPRPDGTLLLFAASGDAVTLSEVTPGGPSAMAAPGLNMPVTAAAGIMLADGRGIAAFGDAGGTLSTWEVGKALTPIGIPRVGHESGVKNLALGVDPTGEPVLLSYSGQGLSAVDSGAEVRLWKVGYLPPQPVLPPEPIGAPIYPAAMIPVGGGQVIALTEQDDDCPFTALLVTEDSLFSLVSDAPHSDPPSYGQRLAVAYADTPRTLVIGRLDRETLEVWRAAPNGLSLFTTVGLDIFGLSRDSSHQVDGPLAIEEVDGGEVLIAVGDQNGLVRLWSLDSQERRRGLGILRRRSRHHAGGIPALAQRTPPAAGSPPPEPALPFARPAPTPFALRQLTFLANEEGRVGLLGLSGRTLCLWGMSGHVELRLLDNVPNVERFALMPPIDRRAGVGEFILAYTETEFVGELCVYESRGERLHPVSERWSAQLEFGSELTLAVRPDGRILSAAGDRNGLVRIWRHQRGGSADLVLSTDLGSAVDALCWTTSDALVAICRSGILRLTGNW